MGEDEDGLMTPSEVASVFRVARSTVTKWAKRGALSSIRTPGGHSRFRASEVQALPRGEAPGCEWPGQPGYVVGRSQRVARRVPDVRALPRSGRRRRAGGLALVMIVAGIVRAVVMIRHRPHVCTPRPDWLAPDDVRCWCERRYEIRPDGTAVPIDP